MKQLSTTRWTWEDVVDTSSIGGYVRGDGAILDIKPDVARQLLTDYAQQRMQLLHSVPNYPFGRFIKNESGEPEPETNVIYRERSPFINYDFKRRCRKGEIVVAPYFTGFGVLSVSSQFNFPPTVVNSGFQWNSRSPQQMEQFYGPAVKELGLKCEWRKILWPYGYNDFKLIVPRGGDRFIPALNNRNVLMKQVLERSDILNNLSPINTSLKSIKDDVVASCKNFVIKDDLVQEAAADANGGDLDALTEIMEMPELIQSIIDGFLLLKKLCVDLRKKELRIHENTEKRILASSKVKHRTWVEQKLKKFPNFTRWKRRNQRDYPSRTNLVEAYNLERESYKRRLDDYDTYLRKKKRYYDAMIAKEYLDAMSGVWLNYRYNIKTTAYSIQDALKAIEDFDTSYMRYRKRKVDEDFISWQDLIGIPGAKVTFSGTCNQTHRVMIKRQYDLTGGFNKLRKVLLADIFVTAFEKIPLWSIIADWFFTISPFLKALEWSPKYAQQGCTYSVKNEIHGDLKIIKNFDHSAFEATVRIDLDLYERRIIYPPHHLGIYFKPDLGFVRQLDALSFFWSKNRGKFKSYYGT